MIFLTADTLTRVFKSKKGKTTPFAKGFFFPFNPFFFQKPYLLAEM